MKKTAAAFPAKNSIEEIKFDYFHGIESEQYSFYRVPKILFTAKCFKILSCEAKVLYGLMLDRMSLSLKNRCELLENCERLEKKLREQLTSEQETLFEECLTEFLIKSGYEQKEYFFYRYGNLDANDRGMLSDKIIIILIICK